MAIPLSAFLQTAATLVSHCAPGLCIFSVTWLLSWLTDGIYPVYLSTVPFSSVPCCPWYFFSTFSSFCQSFCQVFLPVWWDHRNSLNPYNNKIYIRFSWLHREILTTQRSTTIGTVINWGHSMDRWTLKSVIKCCCRLRALVAQRKVAKSAWWFLFKFSYSRICWQVLLRFNPPPGHTCHCILEQEIYCLQSPVYSLSGY